MTMDGRGSGESAAHDAAGIGEAVDDAAGIGEAVDDASDVDKAVDVDKTALESEVREALRGVVDPEIRIDVVALGLIREILFDGDETEVRMILTTPFCPYAGVLVQQVKDMTTSVVAGPVRVTLTDELWSPDMMEGGDLSEWGLL
jgi:metal-sulfur cluster biosynthetic enzyme